MDAENLKTRRRIIRIYAATVVGTVLWFGAILGAPYFRAHRDPGVAGLLYSCFAPFCHQIPSRSFFLWGAPLAVCARCFGIYFGFAVGLIFYPFFRGFSSLRLPALKTLGFLSVPILLDTAANFLGLWRTPNLPRFLTGFLPGTILPLYLITGLEGFVHAVRQLRGHVAGSNGNS